MGVGQSGQGFIVNMNIIIRSQGSDSLDILALTGNWSAMYPRLKTRYNQISLTAIYLGTPQGYQEYKSTQVQ